MTGAELRKERERLGYQSRAAAAIALGLNRASLAKYERMTGDVPKTVELAVLGLGQMTDREGEL
jgi:predicted transcriptional regulator